MFRKSELTVLDWSQTSPRGNVMIEGQLWVRHWWPERENGLGHEYDFNGFIVRHIWTTTEQRSSSELDCFTKRFAEKVVENLFDPERAVDLVLA